jgi:hypothetical protein
VRLNFSSTVNAFTRARALSTTDALVSHTVLFESGPFEQSGKVAALAAAAGTANAARSAKNEEAILSLLASCPIFEGRGHYYALAGRIHPASLHFLVTWQNFSPTFHVHSPSCSPQRITAGRLRRGAPSSSWLNIALGWAIGLDISCSVDPSDQGLIAGCTTDAEGLGTICRRHREPGINYRVVSQ